MTPKRVNLGLQGGGAHGAFTWGALDRLLEDERIEIAGISGTSAGALNGAALKSGWVAGGREGARDNLNWVWGQIGAIESDLLTPWFQALAPSTPLLAKALEYSPWYSALDMASRMVSPYVYGPALQNPLARIVEQFKFEEVCAPEGPELFIGATNVRTGKIKVFSDSEVDIKAILASACLPTLFQAVEIAGEFFWDGGYMGNPALFPLFEDHLPDDIVIVNINPLYREAVPKDPVMIQNRINEISFNSSLLRELRAIDFVSRLLEDGRLEPGTMKNVLVHMVADDALMNDLNVATKLIPTPVILAQLKAAGRAAMDQFLTDHFDTIGQASSVNLRDMFE